MTNRNATSDQDRHYQAACEQYGAALGRLVLGYESDPERRRDLLQEIHLALWTSFATFDGRCALRTWVYRIGHNVAINHAVKDKRHRDTFQVGVDELDAASEALSDSDQIDEHAVLQRLHAMILRLKAPDRQIMLLYLDDLDASSIAQVTGISAANVATKIHRIKKLLARTLNVNGANND